jgi:hypothetical protein
MMPEARRRLRPPGDSRRGVLVWLGALGAVVVLALAGRWLHESGRPPDALTTRITLIGPTAGAHYLGTGQVGVAGRVASPDGQLDVRVLAEGRVIGSLEVEPDADGDFAVRVPILPPVAGGPVRVEVGRAGPGDPDVSVTITLEPANQLIVWSPTSRATVSGDSLAIVGFARPPAASVRMELSLADGTVIATANADLGGSGSSETVMAPWQRFDVGLSLPSDPDEACLRLHASALGKNGRVSSPSKCRSPSPAPRRPRPASESSANRGPGSEHGASA